MNNLCIVGTLGRDLELKYTQSGFAVTTGSVAVKRSFSKEGQQDTDWINVKFLGKSGENAVKYFSKGSKIGLTGSYQIDQYEKDGEKKSFGYMLVNSWEFVESKKQQPDNDYDTNDFQAIENMDDTPF